MPYYLLSKTSDYQNVNVGDIKFYIIASVLVVAVFAMFFIFSKTKGFKIRKREEINSQKDVYANPHIIRVEKTDIDKELYEDKTLADSSDAPSSKSK